VGTLESIILPERFKLFRDAVAAQIFTRRAFDVRNADVRFIDGLIDCQIARSSESSTPSRTIVQQHFEVRTYPQ
jgi:hypothetical protein